MGAFFDGGGGSLIGGAMSFINGMIANEQSRRNTQEAQHYNYQLNEMAAQNADTRTRKLYNDLYSPSAQKQQLLDAGLSPSLMYSSGGVGGSGQAGAQGGASGGTPQTFMPDIMSAMMTSAQIENIKADTEKKREEAKNIGSDTELKQINKEKLTAEIDKIAAETKNTELKNVYQHWLNVTSEYDAHFAEDSYSLRLSQYAAQTDNLARMTEKLVQEIRQTELQNEITEESKTAIIEQTRRTAELTLARIGLTKEQAKQAYEMAAAIPDYVASAQTQADAAKKNAEQREREITEQVAQWQKENKFRTSDQARQWTGQIVHSICEAAETAGSIAKPTPKPIGFGR